jgi:hypothetical protein
VSAGLSIGAPHRHGDAIRIPTVWFAFGLSVLLHLLLLATGWLPNVTPLTLEDALKGRKEGALAVRIAPPARPPAPPAALPAPPAPEARPAPAQKPLTAAPGKAAREAPRVLARERAQTPAAVPQAPAATPAPAPAQASAPAQGDLSAYVEARRRAREPPAPAPPPPAETEQERDNRLAAARLGLNRTPSFDGGERKTGGGIFQIARMGYEDAEIFFYGWNRQIQRNARQMISVRRGDAPSMELAVVRRMIAIIRENTSGDFVWESQRTGRELTLSARPADNAALEEFLMKEFFYAEQRRPGR